MADAQGCAPSPAPAPAQPKYAIETEPGAPSTARTGKDLVNATRAFVEERSARSWRFVASTLVILVATLAIAGAAPVWPIRLAFSVLGGLVLGRTFILYHDFMHGSILRHSRLATILLHGVGLLFLAPPRSWRASHNFHHANVAKLNSPAIGSYPIMTAAAWRRAPKWQRLRYRLARHPLTILAAYLTVFAFTITVEPLLKNPRKSWDSVLALLLHGGTMALLCLIGGAWLAFFALLLPFAIAAALGAYLFYAQHSAPGLRMLPEGEWTYQRAALESSTFLDLGPAMHWFLGNIGYHHVHHLNPSIPFYRLPEAMATIPELQHPAVTTLRPNDIRACFRANLWDEERGEMVSYRDVHA